MNKVRTCLTYICTLFLKPVFAIQVKQIVAEANFSNRAFPVGTEYASWETDEVRVHVYSTQNRFCTVQYNVQVIETEFWRNMLISLLCVFITTVLLIQNIPACIMVLVCVVLTLVNKDNRILDEMISL